MEEKNLELRMYFFVPYNISPIQQAIQAGHAALEYAYQFKDDSQFIEFVKNHKTWIILNGGTTNSQRDFNGVSQGTLNQIADQLLENNIKFSYFQEPDLNHALTAVCFIADEKVWNYEQYLDWKEYVLQSSPSYDDDVKFSYDELKEMYKGIHINWEDSLGGKKNVFLRELLKGKKLA